VAAMAEIGRKADIVRCNNTTTEKYYLIILNFRDAIKIRRTSVEVNLVPIDPSVDVYSLKASVNDSGEILEI
jgi:hypothetical protein